jgi:hypothetical protein
VYFAVLLMSVVGGSAQDPAADAVRYTGTGTVLSDQNHGPEFCRMVMTSYPPQCDGIGLDGWDWKAVTSEAADHTRWGEYRVTGTWNGTRLTLSERPQTPGVPPAQVDTLKSPCPEPAGGWRLADPAKVTEKTMKEAISDASTAADFAGAWLSRTPGSPPSQASDLGDDWSMYVVNLAFTGDHIRREHEIREIWGGALCVSGAEHTESKLNSIRRTLERELDELGTVSISVPENRVEMVLPVVTDELRRTLDDRYGPGVVVPQGMLRPVE